MAGFLRCPYGCCASPYVEPLAVYPEESLSYLASVNNQAARAFYARHGVKLIDGAYEAHGETGEVSLMITKNCLRYSFSLCPKKAAGITGVQGHVRAEPMTLVNSNERLTLKFDCKACEMHVIGKMRKAYPEQFADQCNQVKLSENGFYKT